LACWVSLAALRTISLVRTSRLLISEIDAESCIAAAAAISTLAVASRDISAPCAAFCDV
jgi:hypothetical protein